MSYTIRPVEAKDNKRIAWLVRFCLDEYHAPHEGSAWSDPDLERFSEVYNSPGNAYWVAEDESGTVVAGAGIGSLGSEGVCELRKMYCVPEHRGKGVAHALLETALAYAARYYRLCYLETFSNMLSAHRFYEKHGFTRTDRHYGDTGHYLCDVLYIRTL